MWRLELLRRVWQPPEVIFRTFEPKDLAEASQPIGVERCVLIEAGTTPEENQALAETAAASKLIGAVVPYVDPQSKMLVEELDYWEQNPKFRGIRMRYEGHPQPGILTHPSTIEGLREVARRGLVFEFLVETQQLKDILMVYERVPELKGVVEHMGKPDLRRGTGWEAWSQQMEALAANTGIICKLSISPRAEDFDEIFASLGQGWSTELVKPRVQLLMELFGPEHLMWGSDWPVALLQSDYMGTYGTMREALGPLDPGDELQIFQTTATRFYGLAQHPVNS
jgi:L-fuconolactonase